jgi:hypothetical protein
LRKNVSASRISTFQLSSDSLFPVSWTERAFCPRFVHQIRPLKFSVNRLPLDVCKTCPLFFGRANLEQ